MSSHLNMQNDHNPLCTRSTIHRAAFHRYSLASPFEGLSGCSVRTDGSDLTTSYYDRAYEVCFRSESPMYTLLADN